MVRSQDQDQTGADAPWSPGIIAGLGTLVLAIGFCGASAVAASEFEVGESEFRFSSDLALEGFTPFATSASGSAIYGMRRDTDQYLCFIADQGDDQAERQRVLLAELAGEKPQRTVPNIPVVCILTQ
ncbi:hypothetical protein [uncultured Sulfitobacter sp.]|uniref:hypothetical protein n=1 Tax=uncultured Sulfitobacter sp. TaxID=191468 RepID=UPI002623935E|nr:hypothetical protein [uncultured Sulfitobacter sp.]